MRLAAIALLSAAALVSGCQSGGQQAPATDGKSAALRNMEQVAIAAHRCWIASRDPAFRDYSFANELNSFSGRPRFLHVPKNNFGGRPLLVVQAEGASGQVSTFGPLLQGEHAQRINGDIARWKAGNPSCSGSA